MQRLFLMMALTSLLLPKFAVFAQINAPAQAGNETYYPGSATSIGPIAGMIHAGKGTLTAAFADCPGGNAACTVVADPGQTYNISAPLAIGSDMKPETLICNGAVLNCTDSTGGRDCIDIYTKGHLIGWGSGSGATNTGCIIGNSSTSNITSLVTNGIHHNQAGFDLENVLLAPNPSSTITEGTLWLDSVDGFGYLSNINLTTPPTGGPSNNSLCSASELPFPCCTGSGTGTCTANSGVEVLVDDGPARAGSGYYWNDITMVRMGITCGFANNATGLDIISQNSNGSNLTFLGGAVVDCNGSNSRMINIGGTATAGEPVSVTFDGTYLEAGPSISRMVSIYNAHAINFHNIAISGGTATDCFHLDNSDLGEISFSGRVNGGVCANTIVNDKSGYSSTAGGDFDYYYPGTGGIVQVTDGSTSLTGALMPNGSIATLRGATAGNVYWSQPFQGAALKRTVLNFQGYRNAGATPQTITFPSAYAYPAATSGNCPLGLTVSNTLAKLPSSMTGAFTGQCFVEGQ